MKTQFYKRYRNGNEMYEGIAKYEKRYSFQILEGSRSRFMVRFIKKPDLELILKT